MEASFDQQLGTPRLLQTLSDPTRVRLLRLLDRQELSVMSYAACCSCRTEHGQSPSEVAGWARLAGQSTDGNNHLLSR